MPELADGDLLDLRIAPAVKRLGDETVRMLAYNGSIPGPTSGCGRAPTRRRPLTVTTTDDEQPTAVCDGERGGTFPATPFEAVRVPGRR